LGVESDRCEREDEPYGSESPSLRAGLDRWAFGFVLVAREDNREAACGLPVKWSWTTAMPWLPSAT